MAPVIESNHLQIVRFSALDFVIRQSLEAIAATSASFVKSCNTCLKFKSQCYLFGFHHDIWVYKFQKVCGTSRMKISIPGGFFASIIGFIHVHVETKRITKPLNNRLISHCDGNPENILRRAIWRLGKGFRYANMPFSIEQSCGIYPSSFHSSDYIISCEG